MLSESQKYINAFIQLVKNQKPLFLKDNRNEDLNQAKENFRETEDDLADDIIEWCAKYTDIDEALDQTREGLDVSGEMAGERTPGTTKLKAPPPPPPRKVSRETLLNAIQESFPNQST
ncbi:hypothetical protein QUB60_28140 [Microcoleus sp. A2-C5]|uniref:hypothetical protein n=1 Tax=unclassified Microcoleus TaxID=2642155 RepID=UPI002FD6747A